MADQSYLSIYAKSFNWAGFFLPKQTYLKCSRSLLTPRVWTGAKELESYRFRPVVMLRNPPIVAIRGFDTA